MFKVDDHVRISKYQNNSAKGCTSALSKEAFEIKKKLKNTVPWTYVIRDLKDEETVGIFYEIELQKTNQTEFGVEIVIIRKNDKLYVKWKGYDNSFNSWINEKDIVI